MANKYETVIGLEVHVQLATKTKAFCACKTTFGAKPNTQVCPVCLGLPGVLPVLNKKAFEYSIKVALGLDCDIQKKVKFDRKNYYYPDLPKNYQISQFDMPIAYNGKIKILNDKNEFIEIGITRAHMEEDAGKLIHDENKPFSYVDLNRTGTPLLEIVSEPDLRSPEDAYKYLTVLKQIIEYLEVSDCNMEEGSLRCDANISLREFSQKEFGEKVEIKNLNSFKAVREALIFEEYRQAECLDEKRKIIQETRLWDEKKLETVSMREKENSHDYRYFPEPDLVPFEIDANIVEKIRMTMPELPQEKRKRFAREYSLKPVDVEVLTEKKDIACFYEEVVKHYPEHQTVCNWIKGEVLRQIKGKNIDIISLALSPESLAEIVEMVDKGIISGLAGKEVLEICITTSLSPKNIVKDRGLEQVSDTGELDNIIDEVIRENEKSVNDYRNGKANALSFLVGQVMKKSKGKANPKVAGDLLKEKLD